MKRMSIWGLFLALGVAALEAPGQVEISWSLTHGRTVLMEPVRAVVRIANYSGHDLDLSTNGAARLAFDVEDQPTSTVPATGQPLVRKPVILPANETREVEVNLLDAYRIVKGQSYMLTPILEFDGLRFFGERLSLEVQPGLELLKREYGLLSSGDARRVSLRLIHRDRSDRVFLRIDNSSTGYCLGVYELGRVIRFFVPRLEQDREGNFHVLHQSAPGRFAHSVFGYDGGPLGQTFYSAEAGGIRLVRGEDGGVEVAGGAAFVEDEENPGMLVAPALAPAHPYPTALGESSGPERPAPERKPAPRPSARSPAQSEKSDAGSEPVSW